MLVVVMQIRPAMRHVRNEFVRRLQKAFMDDVRTGDLPDDVQRPMHDKKNDFGPAGRLHDVAAADGRRIPALRKALQEVFSEPPHLLRPGTRALGLMAIAALLDGVTIIEKYPSPHMKHAEMTQQETENTAFPAPNDQIAPIDVIAVRLYVDIDPQNL